MPGYAGAPLNLWLTLMCRDSDKCSGLTAIASRRKSPTYPACFSPNRLERDEGIKRHTGKSKPRPSRGERQPRNPPVPVPVPVAIWIDTQGLGRPVSQ